MPATALSLPVPGEIRLELSNFEAVSPRKDKDNRIGLMYRFVLTFAAMTSAQTLLGFTLHGCMFQRVPGRASKGELGAYYRWSPPQNSAGFRKWHNIIPLPDLYERVLALLLKSEYAKKVGQGGVNSGALGGPALSTPAEKET